MGLLKTCHRQTAHVAATESHSACVQHRYVALSSLPGTVAEAFTARQSRAGQKRAGQGRQSDQRLMRIKGRQRYEAVDIPFPLGYLASGVPGIDARAHSQQPAAAPAIH